MQAAKKVKDLIKDVRTLSIFSEKRVDQVFSGNYRSAFRGRGIEFSEVRPYIEGDDPRSIDWNVTARMGEPFVKIFQETRELSIVILLDNSVSMGFGTGNRSKKETALILSSIISFSALRSNDRIGCLIFDSQVEKFIPPRKGRSHALNVLQSIVMNEAADRVANFEKSLDFLSVSQKKKSVIFLISDFINFSAWKKLQFVKGKHDLVLVRVRDDFEENPAPGLYDFFSFEKNQTTRINFSNKAARNRYVLDRQKEKKKFFNFANKNRIDAIQIQGSDDVFKKLLELFLLREKRKR